MTGAMLPSFLLRMRATTDDDRDRVREQWVRSWARTLLQLFAIEVVVEGAEPARSRRGRLVVSNHRSAIDIGVLLANFGGTMVSRADLASWPLVGQAARAAGTVFVDRQSTKSRAGTIRAIQQHLEEGHTIVLFPEGTTFDGDEVRPFQGGSFIAAARAGAEIVPAGIAYPSSSGAAFVHETFPAHLARIAASDPTRMVLAIGAPILPSADEKASALTARVHEDVARLVARARARCGP